MIDMEGVRVLNIIEHVAKVGPNTDLIIVFVILIVLGIIAFIIGITHLEDFYIVFGIFTIVAAVLMLFYLIEENTKKVSYTYEAIIEDTVNMKEFYKQYEILEVRGEIYEIKERN